MTLKEAAKQIKQLLDALPDKKTNRERLFLIFKVKVLVELIEGEFEKRKEKEAASAAQQKVIKRALKQLLKALDKIFQQHEEVGDTDVRERMYAAKLAAPGLALGLPLKVGTAGRSWARTPQANSPRIARALLGLGARAED
jgi:hypothetical protein